MYTQCPDCNTAFRVTAEVLKQASGRVRCGGCGIAFSALDYLSEQKPDPKVREHETTSLPELKPEPDDPLAEPSDAADRAEEPTGAAEQSVALLKTLDELAGSEVRIEDTGIEWRVIDEAAERQLSDDQSDNQSDDQDDQTASGTAEADQTGSMRFFLEDDVDDDSDRQTETEASSAEASLEDTDDASPDELPDDDREASPDDELGPEPESGSQAAPDPGADSAAADESPAETESGEMRFDDDTPLPDDFAPGGNDAGNAALEVRDPSDAGTEGDAGQPSVDDRDLQVDLALGDPDEWEQLLGEVDDTPEASAAEHTADEDAQEAAGEEPDEPADIEAPAGEDPALEEQEETAGEDSSDAVEDLGVEASPDDTASDSEDSSLEEDPDDRLAAKAQDEAVDGESAAELEVPPETEEEQTINRMIDRDLLALAASDDEDLASTVTGKATAPGDVMQVETIIMEGEDFRDAVEEQRLTDEASAAEDLDEAVAPDEIVLPPKETPPESRPVHYGMLAGVAALALILAAQLAHQSRESLATTPAFDKTLGAVYRLLGRPVTPAWDIAGWRFEATRGSTDQADEILTIYSRIGNKSPDALPYPLITVSLTDRFEEMIGSRVVEPAEYLAEDIDSGGLVPPEQSFEAVISLAAPDALATSYRLSACYRQADGRLRCAMEDFR